MSIEYPKLINRNAKISPRAVLQGPVRIGASTVEKCTISKWTYIGGGGRVGSETTIGAYCSIGQDVKIAPADHPTSYVSMHPFQYDSKLFQGVPGYTFVGKIAKIRKPKTKIGNDVWIGAGAIILAGVEIGDGAVIAAQAVVTKDVEPYSIVAGVPAKIVRFRFSPTEIERFLKVKWWTMDPADMDGIDFAKGPAVLAELERKVLEFTARVR